MKVAGRLKGMAGIADQTIAAKALTAGCNYAITNNGPYDPVTAVYFATGNTMQYWYIVQALNDVGAGNLTGQVTDPWAVSIENESIQTSGPGGSADSSGQDINQVNVASAKALLTGMDGILSQSNVLAMARSYAGQAFAHMPQAILTALGNPASVTAAQPTVASVTVATVTAPAPPPAFNAVISVTKPVAVTTTLAPAQPYVPSNKAIR